MNQRAFIGWCHACRQQVTHQVVEGPTGIPAIGAFCGCTEQEARTAPGIERPLAPSAHGSDSPVLGEQAPKADEETR